MNRQQKLLATSMLLLGFTVIGQGAAIVQASDFVCAVQSPRPAVHGAAVAQPAAAETCDGTCTIDVAFSYYPAAVDGRRHCYSQSSDGTCLAFSRRAENPAELKRYLRGALAVASGAFQASGLDAEFRLVHIGPMGSNLGRPAGADLWYAVDPERGSFGGSSDWAGTAVLPSNVAGDPLWHEDGLDGAVALDKEVYRESATGGSRPMPEYGWSNWPFVLAHEFGHSLGLHHGEDSILNPGTSSWLGGNGFWGQYYPPGQGDEPSVYTTIMSTWGAPFPTFSAVGETMYGRPIGDVDANAVPVLRHNIPYLARRHASAVEEPPDYGCEPNLCIGNGRFLVEVVYFVDGVCDRSRPECRWASATRLPTGVGGNAGLYFFFEPDNPEVLLKVLDGCWLNDHWWVFGSAATDVHYSVYILDLATMECVQEGEVTTCSADRIVYTHGGSGLITGPNNYTGLGVITDAFALPCAP